MMNGSVLILFIWFGIIMLMMGLFIQRFVIPSEPDRKVQQD